MAVAVAQGSGLAFVKATAQALAKPPPDHAAGLAAEYTTSRAGSEEADARASDVCYARRGGLLVGSACLASTHEGVLLLQRTTRLFLGIRFRYQVRQKR